MGFTVSLAGAQHTNAPVRQAAPAASEFVVEVARDGFQGTVVEGLPGKIYQAEPVFVEAQPVLVEAKLDHQSPCLLTPPAAQEPQQHDGWFFHH